mgnify:FL=1
MEPTVQERMAGTVDREVMVVRVGRMGMLKIEDKAEQNQRGREGPRLLIIAKISHLLLSWHVPVDVRVGGGRCREDF